MYLYYYVMLMVYRVMAIVLNATLELYLTTLVLICTDCIYSCKSNYRTTTTTTLMGLYHSMCKLRYRCFYSFRFYIFVA